MSNKEFIPEYLPVFSVSIRNKNLQPLDNLVLGAIYWYERLKDGRCFASNAAIARVVNSTPQTVKNSLRRLESEGYIKSYYKDPAKRHRTQIVCCIRQYIQQPDVSGDTSQSNQVVHLDVSGDAQKENSIKNRDKEYNKGVRDIPLQPDGKPDYESIPYFVEFWNHYPSRNGKKVGKRDTAKEWLKLSPDEQLRTEIMRALTLENKARQQATIRGEFFPVPKDPHRWLQKKCWEDEIVVTQQRKTAYLHDSKIR